MSRWGSNKISPENVRITSQPNYRGGARKATTLLNKAKMWHLNTVVFLNVEVLPKMSIQEKLTR